MSREKTANSDDFDSAFGAFSSEEDVDIVSTPDEDATDQDTQPGEDAADQDTQPGDDAPDEDATDQDTQPGEDAADQDTQPGDDDPDDAAPEDKLSDDDLLARFATLVGKAKPNTTEKPAAQVAPAKEEPAPEEPPLYTDAEQQLIQSYEEEWPEVARAESLKRRGEYRAVVQHIFAEVQKVIEPIVTDVDSIMTQTHLTQLQDTVEDYDDIRDNVVGWVEQQPTYLQDAYKRVIQSGTVEEVTDLIGRYRADTGTQQPPKKTAPAQKAQPKKDAELPTAAKKAAAALAPVRSKRTDVPQGTLKDDFDAAFVQFAKAEKI